MRKITITSSKMPYRKKSEIPKAWSMETLPPPGMVTSRPLRKKGLFHTQTCMEGSWQVLAAQTLKIASINGLGELDKLENELEDEIRYENRSPSKTAVGRLRRQGQHQLHSKVVLLIVVVLNVIDCLLVMAELTLDFHHVSHRLQNKLDMLESFIYNMITKHAPVLDNIPRSPRKSNVLLQKILDANVVWDTSQPNVTNFASNCAHLLKSTAENASQSLTGYMSNMLNNSDWSEPNACFQPYMAAQNTTVNSAAANQKYMLSTDGQTNEKLTIVAHKLHYISISILSVLVVILLLKMICSGKRFFRSRMQVFDGIVIIISFILDLVFIEGVTILKMDDFVLILTFLLPWRILRVLNSLIVAVLDKQRLNLKIIYTQKKKISRNLSEVNNKMEVMQRHIEVLQNLCSSRGLADGDVKKVLGRELSTASAKSGSSQKNGSSGGLAGMMALGKLAFQAADAFAPITQGSRKSHTPKTTKQNKPALNGSAPNLLTPTEEDPPTPPHLAHSMSQPQGESNTTSSNSHVNTVAADIEDTSRPSFTLHNETGSAEGTESGIGGSVGGGIDGSGVDDKTADKENTPPTPTPIPTHDTYLDIESQPNANTGLETSDSSTGVNTNVATTTTSPDSVTVQIANGSGPPMDLDSNSNEERKTSVSLPDFSDDIHLEDSDVVSRL
ncbi:uncharacterized protein LOC101857936 [Aplysia californica]|uniref:Uncharacterized protein LOC101857936 n=1 Tax=Aplysia californica TaxID=6500 RepID=A0ABM0ZVR6_APLCA|nr:uncharacterized protein LOC101857936 [Aplysia californica]